jgi:hypothetical protein
LAHERLLEENQGTSKHTGFLFARDDALLLPEALRPGFVGMVDGMDSVQAQIDAFRPQIEMLIYWENLTNTLSIYFIANIPSMDPIDCVYLVSRAIQLFFLLVHLDLMGSRWSV